MHFDFQRGRGHPCRVLPSGDAFLHAAKGRSNQMAVLIDSTGRTYALPAHELPSAKGHGEPLSSSLTPPPGAAFVGVMMGDPDDLWLLTTDDGYGFVCRIDPAVKNSPRDSAIHGAGIDINEIEASCDLACHAAFS